MDAFAAGAVIVGDELLSGRREDRHLRHLIGVLRARAMRLAWCRLVGDERSGLSEELSQTRRQQLPVFCFGGIGATPDDQTRPAAAQAFERELVRHTEAAALIEAQFGSGAWPNRIRMADLPRGASLIPNPVNRIPGFTLDHHHFLPGFPEMAWPMLDWVLDEYYRGRGAPMQERAVHVFGVPESQLLEMMEELVEQHPQARLFSLPQLGDKGKIELGFRGSPDAVERAFQDLLARLASAALSFELGATR
jgi:molybdopterin-biosynthesis enzyme MoeA-like protein